MKYRKINADGVNIFYNPEKILGIVSQNGNVYQEGLGKKWAKRAQYWKHPTKELREQYKSAFAKDTVIGLNRLYAVHLNDSKNPCGSHKDRHERIGKGCIGEAALMAVVTHPLLQGRPFILETPNDDDGYKEEIAMVKEAENHTAPPELTDRQIYDTPIGPVCMSKTEHEAYLEELEIRKLKEK